MPPAVTARPSPTDGRRDASIGIERVAGAPAALDRAGPGRVRRVLGRDAELAGRQRDAARLELAP